MNKTLPLSIIVAGFLIGAVATWQALSPIRVLNGRGKPAAASGEFFADTSSTALTASMPVIEISATPSVRNVPGLGVNIGQWGYYQAGAGEFQNLIQNPGFEKSEAGRVVVVPSSGLTGSTFCDNTKWYSYPSGFFSGAVFQDVYTTGSGATAAATTRGTGTITSYNPTGCASSTPQFGYSAGFAIKAGDYIMLSSTGNINPGLQSPGYPPAGWWNNDAQWTPAADNQPNSDGKQALQLQLNGSSHRITQYSDATSDYTNSSGGRQNFLLVNGAWKVSLWAKSVNASANASVNVSFGRLGGATWVNQTFTPPGAWTQYSWTFNGTESSLTRNIGALQFMLTGNGSSGGLRFDDVFVGPANATAPPWSNQFVSVLQSLRPGVIRAWQSDAGNSFANMIADDAARGTSPAYAGGTSSAAWVYSLDAFLKLAKTVGAVPWVNVPMSLTDSELSSLGTYFASEQAKYNFPAILLEVADEQWNGISCGGVCTSYSGDIYTAIDGRAFNIIKSAAGAGVPLQTIAEGQYGAYPPGGNVSFVAATAKAQGMNYVDMAPYYWFCDDGNKSTATLLSDFLGDANIQLPAMQSVLNSLNGLPAVGYESGPSTWWGTMSNAQRNGIIAGAASATADAELALNWWSSGGTYLNAWNLVQTNYSSATRWSAPGLCTNSDSPSQMQAYMWGVVHDFYRPLIRPRGLAMKLLNTYFLATRTGNFYSASGSVPGVIAGAWEDNAHGFGWSVAAANTTAESQTVSIRFPASSGLPAGRTWQIAHRNSITDQNEQCVLDRRACVPAVTIQLGSTIQTGPDSYSITVSIPPYGVIVGQASAINEP